MSFPLLILRPKVGARKTAIVAETLGIEPVTDPLFEIQSLAWSAPSSDNYDAIMFTSVNAIKMAGPNLSEYLELPALAVGEITAKAASEAGFQIAIVGEGGAQSLADSIPENKFPRILRMTGKEHMSVRSDRSIETIIAYQSVNIGLGQKATKCLCAGCVILLHSTRAAQSLEVAMDEAAIDRGKNHIIAISTGVAETVRTGWGSIHIAKEPTDDALLSAAARLCSR